MVLVVSEAAAGEVDINAAPTHTLHSLASFEPTAAPGASRYRHTLPGGEHLDALLVNRASDVLVVTFHGALDRQRFALPRFERVRTTLEHDVSGLFIADPALWRSPSLELAWYTGWRGLDMHQVAADWARVAAAAVGASRVVFSGSSGGGFAALQAARLLPGSVAVPFNPQTSIYGYLAEGHSYGPQRTFIATIHPELAPDGAWAINWGVDWSVPLGDTYSAVRSYSRPVPNFVFYVDNTNDFHHEQHYEPFMAASEVAGNLDRIRTYSYDGRSGHRPPDPAEFHAAMGDALSWTRTLPPADTGSWPA